MRVNESDPCQRGVCGIVSMRVSLQWLDQARESSQDHLVVAV